MKKLFFCWLAFSCFFSLTGFAQSIEVFAIAKKFCTAVYNNNIPVAKSYMTTDGARRTPDRMSFSANEKELYLTKLKHAKYKVIQGVTSSIVTVRFYDPQYEYLDKRGRWFCCAVTLVKTSQGWKVENYGY